MREINPNRDIESKGQELCKALAGSPAALFGVSGRPFRGIGHWYDARERGKSEEAGKGRSSFRGQMGISKSNPSIACDSRAGGSTGPYHGLARAVWGPENTAKPLPLGDISLTARQECPHMMIQYLLWLCTTNPGKASLAWGS
jgi:hypothetical protein